MTTLTHSPIIDGQLDLLDAVAAAEGPLDAEDFREACMEVARRHNGWVNPNHVSALMHERFDVVKPRWFSAQWAGACGRNGFMIRTDIDVPIDPTYSRGNGNKAVKMRRLRTAA